MLTLCLVAGDFGVEPIVERIRNANRRRFGVVERLEMFAPGESKEKEPLRLV